MALVAADLRVPRERNVTQRLRAVRPKLRIDGIRQNPRGGLLLGDGNEETRFAELARENRWCAGGRIWGKALDGSTEIDNVEFALVVFSEADDSIGCGHEFARFREAAAVMAQ